MKKRTSFHRCLAGLLSLALVLGLLLPGNVINAQESENTDEIITEAIATEAEAVTETPKESEPVTEPITEPVTEVPAETEEITEAPTEEDSPEYIYEDSNLYAKVTLSDAQALPAGAVLDVRRVTDKEELKALEYYLLESVDAEKSAINGYLPYELYFAYNGEEIIPSAGDVSVELTFKNKNVPDTFKDGEGENKEVKLYQLMEDAQQNVFAADMDKEIQNMKLSKEGDLEEVTFKLTTYRAFAFTWKQDKIKETETESETKYPFELQYADSEIKATATVYEEGVLPADAKLVVEPLTEEEQIAGLAEKIKEHDWNDGKVISDVKAYDVRFEKDGTEIEPKGLVEIKIDFVNELTMRAQGDTYLLHEKQSGALEEISADIRENGDGHVTEVGFESDEFSPYVLVRRRALIPAVSSVTGDTLSGDKDALKFDKTASYDESTGYATIAMESYVTGKLKLETVTKPLDIILVLDESSSMYDQFYTTGTTKEAALREALTEFLKLLMEGDSAHRITVVGFSHGSRMFNIENLPVTPEKAYSTITSANKDKVLGLVDKYYASEGATHTDDGMQTAYRTLQANADSTNEKVVILFTDGRPTGIEGSDQMELSSVIGASDFYLGRSTSAIRTANNIKAMGVPIYTIGIEEGTNAADTEKYTMNRFLNYVSSNYAYADSLKDNGAARVDNKYYQVPANVQELIEIFKTIQQETGGSSVDLNGSTVVVDNISKYFSNPGALDVKLYTQDYTGVQTGDDREAGNWGSRTPVNGTINITDNRIEVSGFDYAGNYVANLNETGAPRGKKLVVEVRVKVKDGFIGGNKVPTNDGASVQTADGVELKTAPNPEVDIPLKYNFTTSESSVFIGDDWKEVEKLFGKNENGIPYTIGNETYYLGNSGNDFVDVTYTIKNEKGEIVDSYTVKAGASNGTLVDNGWDTTKLTKDQKYKIEVTVSPSIADASGVAELKTPEKQTTLHVFKPSLSVDDKVIFYGDSANLTERVKKDTIVWSCEHGEAAKPEGAVAELTFEYKEVKSDESTIVTVPENLESPENAKIQLVVKKGDTDISAHTTFTNTSKSHDKDAKDYQFTIFVVKGQLDITKEIDKQYTDISATNSNQSFVFRIERRDTANGSAIETFYATAGFDANGNTASVTETIYGLKKGYYTVTEETAWASKYDYTGTTNNYTQEILFIGEEYAGSGLADFYGTAQDTAYEKYAKEHVATVNVTSTLDTSWKWVSDVAAAINKFVN